MSKYESMNIFIKLWKHSACNNHAYYMYVCTMSKLIITLILNTIQKTKYFIPTKILNEFDLDK